MHFLNIILWEHGHAYQPRRLTKVAVLDIERDEEVRREFELVIGVKRIKAENLMRLALKPESTYDHIILFLDYRSIDIEPITLKYLKMLNKEAYYRLKDKISRRISGILATAYSHPMLPLLYIQSKELFKICIWWSINMVLEEFGSYFEKQLRKGYILLGFWLPECAITREILNEIYNILCDIAYRRYGITRDRTYLLVLLDEGQGPAYPGRIYRYRDNPQILLAFRDHGLSDVISFVNDYNYIIEAYRHGLARYNNGEIVGIACDAENYGGHYNPCKPFVLELVRYQLTNGINTEKGTVRALLKPISIIVEEIIEHNTLDKLDKIDLRESDYTSWSDYFIILDPYQKYIGEGMIGERVGGLARWSGEVGHIGSRETYFILYIEGVKEASYMRIISSIGKIVFNHIRSKVSNIVLSHCLSILDKFLGEDKAWNLILDSWRIAMAIDEYGEYLKLTSKFRIPPPYRKAIYHIIKSIQYILDSQISCPTYWPNLKNELTYTSLNLLAASLAKTYRIISGMGENAYEIEKIFKEYFLNPKLIDHPEINKIVLDYKYPFKTLIDFLSKAALSRGFNFIGEVRRMRMKGYTFKDVCKVAESLYERAAERWGLRIKPCDVNYFAIKAFIEDDIEDDSVSVRQAKIFEFKKAFYEGDTPITYKVGIKYAKYFKLGNP